jgi:hypothetical protein
MCGMRHVEQHRQGETQAAGGRHASRRGYEALQWVVQVSAGY